MTAIDKLKESVVCSMPHDEMQEYVKLSTELGLTNPKARLEQLKSFLAENGITVFPLQAVDDYLRKKATKEGGPNTYWCWKPLRLRDRRKDAVAADAWASELRSEVLQWRGMRIGTVPADLAQPARNALLSEFTREAEHFGRAAERMSQDEQVFRLQRMYQDILQQFHRGARARTMMWSDDEPLERLLGVMDPVALPHGRIESAVYGHSIPHAVLLTMKKVADAFPDAQFMATDYAVKDPDPFLAVTLPEIKEFFIIERWDEPGFRM